MPLFSRIRTVGIAIGVWRTNVIPIGCSLGRTIYYETKRAAQIANLFRPHQELLPETLEFLRSIFPDLDVSTIRYRSGCRLPPNKFHEGGSIIAMTFGTTIYWQGTFDEKKPEDLVNFIHEVCHVDQVRRYGGEDGFACEYGKGYLNGGGELPDCIRRPSAYHRNALEAEAYNLEAEYQDENGRVVRDRLPI